MNKYFTLAEKIFTIFSLLHYTGGPLAVILSGGASEGDGLGRSSQDNLFIQLLFFLNFLISFVLLVLRWKKVVKILSQDRYITIIIGLCFLSLLWSAAPTSTLVRSVAILGNTLFGIYLATRYSFKQQLQILVWTCGIAIFMSFLFAVALPRYGLESGIHAGAFRGIYAHKNLLGRVMVFSSVVFLINATENSKNRLLFSGGFLLSVILLILSKSSSSLVNFAVIFIMFFMLRTLLLRYDLLFPVLFLLTIVGQISGLLLINNADSILSSLGKDSNLTGRTPLWNAVLDMIWQRPWLGYGYSGFWGGGYRESAYIELVTGWNPPHAHNGFLDICIDLGLLGLSIFLIGFLINFLKGLAWLRISRTAASFWPVMYMIYFWLTNQTESALLRQNEFYWLIYVTVIISMLIPSNRLKDSISESS
ncbi:O-antigen ligase [Nostoc sp. FACHB-110]|uniref:O-antigen ligase family protein n=1 Tax=Nostoc sp. FACHB-110 TaxID=2692834 RepID=UPI001683B27C|nr:O-antigen ligase [Nostoc sp. FACHB-110]MBD2435783.1 O-antigen ligase family protein [Nostoc sp. FACHB-110]